MRHAQVAGQFYPSEKEELRKMINKLFSSLEVASLKSRDIKMAIVPHAGYAYSGKCASFVYKLLEKQEFETFIILGTNHSGLGSKLSLSIEDFETSLGQVSSDMEIIEEIITRAVDEKLDVSVDENSHRYEHSIEVQLPFLQLVEKKFKIVPILVKELEFDEIQKFAKILAEIIRGRKIFLLVSSDFTHYGASYGFMPFKDVRENLYKLDGEIISSILKLNTKAFYDKSSRSTVCGKDAVACVVEAAKILKLKPEKLCYYTSGDVLDDWDVAVGYASLVFS
jgi:AmmeMemoRadiSam system protein B